MNEQKLFAGPRIRRMRKDTIAGDHPDVELGIGTLGSGGDGQCSAVDAVQPVGVHVVRKTAATPDS